MGKLGKEFKRIGKQVASAVAAVEPAVRHAVQKVDVRVKLGPYRQAAQGALESAEKELAEMTVVFATANGIETDIKTRLESSPLAASEDDQKFVGERVDIIRSGVQRLSEARTQVAAKKAVVCTERGKVSSIPNEVENSDHAEAGAKAASSKAMNEAAAIRGILVEARNTLLNIQAAQREIIARIQASKDVKDTKETQEQPNGKTVWTGSEEEPDVVQSAAEDLPAVAQEPLNVPGYRIPVAQPVDDVVREVLNAEAAAVEAAAPPPCGVELSLQGAANEAGDLPPEYEPNLAVVVHIEQHIESKAQAEDPQAAQIRQLQEQIAAMQRQQAEQMAAMQQRFVALLAQQGGAGAASSSPSPVVTPLRDLQQAAEANIQGDNNVPVPVASQQAQMRSSIGQQPF